MKTTPILLALAALYCGAPASATALPDPVRASVLAQDDAQQAEFKASYEKKLSKDFVAFGGWLTDYDEARARAKREGKLLFTYFSRSYSP